MNFFTRPFLIWFFGSSLVVLILSLLFAYAPQPLKRLGLSYAMFGILSGSALAFIAKDRQLRFTKGGAFTAILIVSAGGVHMGWVSYQQFKAVRAKQLQDDPKQLAMLNMMEKMADEATALELRKRRREMQPQFMDYLAFRVSRIGKWSAPWPQVFWSGELVLATCLAVGILFRTVGAKTEFHLSQNQKAEQTD